MREILSVNMKKIEQGGIRHYAGRAEEFEDAISLCIGEPDFTTPGDIIEAAYKAMSEGKTHYTLNAGLEELRYEISQYAKKFQIESDYKSEIIVTCGAMASLFMTFLAILDPGDEVILTNPFWLNYKSQIEAVGGIAVECPVDEEHDFVMRAEEIEKKITGRTKAILLNSPSNPTGSVIPWEELQKIARLAIEKDLYVISDEIYCELIYDEKTLRSIASVEGMKERTIVINGFSKSFAMTGWRLGYTIAPRKLVDKMAVLQESINSCASSLAQYAGIYALQTMLGVADMVATYKKRRTVIVEGLNSIDGITCKMPKGAFYAFPNISSFGKSSREFAEELIEHTHVLTVPGSCFGDGGEGFLRISYASSQEELKEAILRIRNYIEK